MMATLYLVYFMIFFGIASVNYTYLRHFSSFVQFCVAVFLIYKFNPFFNDGKITLNAGDSSVIHGSGVFLLINLGATEFVIRFYNDIIHKNKLDIIPEIITTDDGEYKYKHL
jgi:hypothetical protein